MEDKLLTIIMPVYNSHDFLEEALNSIPSRDDVEVICIDDCSTDDSYQILQRYDRIPLKIFKTDKNSGPGAARNIGLCNSSGKYIFFMDSDDKLCTDVICKFMNNVDDNYDIHTGRCIMNNGIVSNTVTPISARYSLNYSFIKRELAISVRHPEEYNGEDSNYAIQLLKKNPKLNLTDNIFFYYNCPRIGSLTWLHKQNRGKEK